MVGGPDGGHDDRDHGAHDAKFRLDDLTSKRSLELLNRQQMPKGFTATVSTSDGVGRLTGLLEPKGVKHTPVAQAYFLDSTDELPRFDEKIATYSNTTETYEKIIATINACHSIVGTFDSETIMGNVAPMIFFKYNVASAVYSMYSLQFARDGAL